MTFALRRSGFDEVTAMFAEMDIEGDLSALIERVGYEALETAERRTPVQTGAMLRSWLWRDGRLFVSPSVVNPVSGQPVLDYAAEVDQRVGILDAALVTAERVAVEGMETIGWEE